MNIFFFAFLHFSCTGWQSQLLPWLCGFDRCLLHSPAATHHTHKWKTDKQEKKKRKTYALNHFQQVGNSLTKTSIVHTGPIKVVGPLAKRTYLQCSRRLPVVDLLICLDIKQQQHSPTPQKNKYFSRSATPEMVVPGDPIIRPGPCSAHLLITPPMLELGGLTTKQ